MATEQAYHTRHHATTLPLSNPLTCAACGRVLSVWTRRCMVAWFSINHCIQGATAAATALCDTGAAADCSRAIEVPR
eukprot:scaffold164411_cov44-Tisochrysis_lutea.AAC.1